MEQEAYITRLRKEVPGLANSKIRFIGEGWDHAALEADGMVFRLPFDEQPDTSREVQVKTEVEILHFFDDKLPINIPKPSYIDPDFEYFGYAKLPGALARKKFSNFSEDDKQRYMQDWVNIASAIHGALTPQQARSLGVPAYSPKRIIDGAKKLYSLNDVHPEWLKFAESAIKKLESQDLASRPQVFLHNDFHRSNTLIDTKTHAICALIDWSDAAVGPVDEEFSVWVWDAKEDMEKVARLYEQKTGVAINLDIARTLGYVEEISDYAEQCLEGDVRGADESADHITRWITEIR